MASAWWFPRARRVAAMIGLGMVVVLALAMLVGVIDPETCGCFGRLRVSRARHIFALGLLAILSSLGVLLDPRADLQVSS